MPLPRPQAPAMPELPDVTLYVDALRGRVVGRVVSELAIRNTFVLRSVAVPPSAWTGRTISGVSRFGKRIVLHGADDHHLVIHLMIAGRLRWLAPGKKPPGKLTLALLAFEHGTLVLTEAGSKRRASMHLVQGRDALAEFVRGGLEPLEVGLEAFAQRLRSENHTIKRSLTDPSMFSGIGNAYSDEILNRARLGPLVWTSRLTDEEVARLHRAMREVLVEWTDRLRGELVDGWPAKVTAFHAAMAVHGRNGKPCPVCDTPVQRIRYAENETNYCARCQTGGRLLADRALSRLLRDDWPRSIDEW